MKVDFINSLCFTQSLYYSYNENWNQSQPLLGSHIAHGWNIPIRGKEHPELCFVDIRDWTI